MKRAVMAAGLIAAAAATQAADLPKEGSYDFTACWSGNANPIAFSKTHTVSNFEMTGSTRSNPPGGMFDKNSFRCTGTNAMFGKTSRQLTVCEAVDGDGDKRLTSYVTGADGKIVREFVAGTGKYEGMVETDAQIQQFGPWPTIKPGTFQNCNRQTGKYKLK